MWQAEWLAEVGPALGRLGDDAGQAAVFARIERLAAGLEQPKEKHRALVHLAVALHRAGQGEPAEPAFAQAAALLDVITDPDAVHLAAYTQIQGLAATGRGEAAWAFADHVVALPFAQHRPCEQHFLRWRAFTMALESGFEGQALWMLDRAASQEERDSFRGWLVGALAQAGRFDEARAALAQIADSREKAELMAVLAQAMIRAKGGPLRPAWVQTPDPSVPYTHTLPAIWPLYRDPPLFSRSSIY